MPPKKRILTREQKAQKARREHLPNLREERDQVLAILVSDIHLSHRPPRARRHEDDWFQAMANSLRQLEGLSLRYRAPILCAGDVFDHWKAEPELINFALGHLPEMYAIPGQHDLPLHNIDLIHRSAFWTMVLTGRIRYVPHEQPIVAENDLVIHGFPWGQRIRPFEKDSRKFHVALCHEFFWTAKHSFPGAPEEQEASAYKDRIQGWHAVAYGDNHKGFLTTVNGTHVLNCGGFMRRKTDEEHYRPHIGILCKSGRILRHHLKLSGESFTSEDEDKAEMEKILRLTDMGDFISGLSELQKQSFDFIAAMEFAMEKKRVSPEVRSLIAQSLERK